jgi:hypothetical protein
MSYLEQYRQGKCIQVWAELEALGDQVRIEPVFSDAWSVAQETMRRVRYNLDLLIPRLQELGYVFGYGWVQPWELDWAQSNPPLRTPPPANVRQLLDAFEQKVGILPLSLRAFYEEIGGVNFVGSHPQWQQFSDEHRYFPNNDYYDCYQFDPLFVEAPSQEFFDSLLEWEPYEKRDDLRYPLDIAPDSFHKMNVSGGAIYQVEVPNAGADAPLLGEWHQTSFVNYLCICLHYGGLPGLEGMESELAEELEYLRAGLLTV